MRNRKNSELETVTVTGERETGYEASRSQSATKTDTPLIDTPQAITVITQELIQDQAMQGMADVVRYVPGVGMAQGEGNRDTPIFRGSSSTADLFIDGMRDDVQYFRDLYNIERVEALKGSNAMIFGRGGSGGVLNRVTKQADGETRRDLNLQVGSWGRLRASADVSDAINDDAAFRINALVEETDSFRDDVSASRRGINPTLSFLFGDSTDLVLGVEHFEDERTADRGISSMLGKPVDVDPSTFFGDPDRSQSKVEANTFSALWEHGFANGANLRNRTLVGRYDKFYQNVFPGAARASDDTVTLSAYRNDTRRDNLLNQTDLVFVANTGSIEHKLLVGAELGRQETDNFRETGYFSDTCATAETSVRVSLDNPRYTGPLCFKQSTSDADNHGVARTTALYVQDQIEFSPNWLAVIGLRYDHFELDLHNNRTGDDLSSSDSLVSPRVGLIYKPQANISIYANMGKAFLPRSGEQLASLSATNQSLEPEEFNNLELGAKWDISPTLAATAAVYRLTRSNVAVVDPLDSRKLVLLTGDSQRVEGIELGLSGKISEKWSVMGGFAYQEAQTTQDVETSPGTVLPAGRILPQVPRRTFSLWNRYDFNPRWGAALGLIARDKMFTSTSNAVTLPGYARVDGAVFFAVSENIQMQLNVENLLDREYFVSAHSDTNISPGSPRAVNLGLHLSF
ncbi:MAG: TonB-dependent receptor [Gammaproteobacteria bacterium RIFCSPHIGHO2_12_FULL_63_22]|nr:MAG: TonB-dependent receptor [Gammaproteobacteria bacterium RIFCSPHIGHO2_12_FULL_63_22]